MANSYCVDMHSRSGYSGSPVFVYRTPAGDLELTAKNATSAHSLHSLGAAFLGLLGIHWGQFPESWPIEGRRAVAGEAAQRGPLVLEGQSVKGVSGMTCVLPAAHIVEVLNMPVLRNARTQRDQELAEYLRKHGGLPPDAESANPEAPDRRC
jgi:hypothetical protein